MQVVRHLNFMSAKFSGMRAETSWVSVWLDAAVLGFAND